MELLADRDPEEARKLLDPLLERMMEAVRRFTLGQPSDLAEARRALDALPG